MAFRLADAVAFLSVDDSDLDSGLETAEEKTTKSMGGIGTAAKLAIGGVFVGLAAAATTALVKVGQAALTVSQDTKAAAANLSAGLGVTIEKGEEYAQVARDVFANNFGESVTDAADAVEEVVRQLDIAANDPALPTMVENALAIRDVFETDVADTVSAVRTLMWDLGLTSDEAFDFIAAGMQRGLNNSGDFIDTINEYGPQFSNAGADAGQFFSIMETGMAGGMLGVDKAADAFKEFRLRIQDGSETTRAALAEIGIDYDTLNAQINDGSITVVDAWDQVIEKLGQVDDQSTVMAVGSALLGTQFEDLGQQIVLAMDSGWVSMENLEGATDSLNAKYNTMGSTWEGLWRRVVIAAVPLTDQLLDLAEQQIPRVESALTSLSEKLPTIFDFLATENAQALNDWMNSVMESVVDAGDQWLGAIAAQNAEWIASHREMWVAAGGEWVSGMLEGIQAEWQRLRDWISEAIKKLPSWGGFGGGGGDAPPGNPAGEPDAGPIDSAAAAAAAVSGAGLGGGGLRAAGGANVSVTINQNGIGSGSDIAGQTEIGVRRGLAAAGVA